MEERIQKILAKCGIASRRKAEEAILKGMVTVNGEIAVLGMKADAEKDSIKVNGKLIKKFESKVYIILNKPNKCITSMYDPEGRITIKDFLKGVKARVFPVGRLDYDSEGLVLMTNDGELANAILHPKGGVSKTYFVKIKGILNEKDIQKLERGIRLEGRITAPAKVTPVKKFWRSFFSNGTKKMKKAEANSWIEIIIHEGRKHQVKLMFERVGHPVLKLKRLKIDGLELGRLPVGAYRYLAPEEVKRLKKAVFSY